MVRKFAKNVGHATVNPAAAPTQSESPPSNGDDDDGDGDEASDKSGEHM